MRPDILGLPLERETPRWERERSSQIPSGVNDGGAIATPDRLRCISLDGVDVRNRGRCLAGGAPRIAIDRMSGLDSGGSGPPNRERPALAGTGSLESSNSRQDKPSVFNLAIPIARLIAAEAGLGGPP